MIVSGCRVEADDLVEITGTAHDGQFYKSLTCVVATTDELQQCFKVWPVGSDGKLWFHRDHVTDIGVLAETPLSYMRRQCGEKPPMPPCNPLWNALVSAAVGVAVYVALVAWRS